MKKLSLICMVLLLSACGGGGGNAGTRPTPTPPPTPDAFHLRVLGFIGLAPEDAEAAEVADIPVTAPEDSDPPGT